MIDTKFKLNDEVVVTSGFYRGRKFKLTGYSENLGYWGYETGRYWNEAEIDLVCKRVEVVIKTGKPWYNRIF